MSQDIVRERHEITAEPPVSVASVDEVALWLTGLLGPAEERKLAEQLCRDFTLVRGGVTTGVAFEQLKAGVA